MKYRDAAALQAAYRCQIAEIREKIRVARSAIEPEDVQDYVFATPEGPVSLSALFGDKDTLFVVHNMGTGCANCTMWADGFSGVFPHLRDRAAFVVSSPDAPDRQQRFAADRGWRFPMVSTQGTTFAEDMGYRSENGPLPGLSVFKRQSGRMVRVADSAFDRADDFCPVWHLFDLLPESDAGWRPKNSYAG
ncbi:MAG TPA: DUF899 family protein [Aliidongia sp.]|uniref:DUF899 family protein n=1 Tax=Aliidongia sp. TaxID=1914230 RepID=UPI002DDD14D8|nr:DUF899 family protein [Aliidongia sp.]HEV2678571.1 DUF899 family protein [Aliidongia sp.]